MVNYASTPSARKETSKIRSKMSQVAASMTKDSKRSGGVSFKSKVGSEELKVETPVQDYKKDLDELKKQQELQVANLKELMLKMSQKLKKVSEWKPLISKDTKKLKKQMKHILEKEEKEE